MPRAANCGPRFQRAEADLEAANESYQRAKEQFASASATAYADDDDVGSLPEREQHGDSYLRVIEARAVVGGLKKQISQRDITTLEMVERLKEYRDRLQLGERLPSSCRIRFNLPPNNSPKCSKSADALGEALGVTVQQAQQLPSRGNWDRNAEAVEIHREMR